MKVEIGNELGEQAVAAALFSFGQNMTPDLPTMKIIVGIPNVAE